MSKVINCPYCKAENNVEDALNGGVLSADNTLDWTCRECEEDFELAVEIVTHFNASEIIYVNCDKCGEETRKIYRKDTVYPFPEIWLEHDEKVCHKCWSKGIEDELIIN